MISDHDRSGWFGASDVRYIMGNRKTKSFENWWAVKLGLTSNNFTNTAMQAGTMYEHSILEFCNVPEMDKQILIPELLLRVNLDGNDDETDFEVKTYKYEKGFTVPKHYEQQVNVQMFASKLKKGVILAYGLVEEDYRNFFRPIDKTRLSRHRVEYNGMWIEKEFLPKLKYYAELLKEGRWPL